MARCHKKFPHRLAAPEPLTQAEIEENYVSFATEDFQIGHKVFLAKEKPDFKGK